MVKQRAKIQRKRNPNYQTKKKSDVTCQKTEEIQKKTVQRKESKEERKNNMKHYKIESYGQYQK